MGKNWQLELGAVTRDTREGVPRSLETVAPSDRFLLNGNLLVRVGGDRYRTEIESHESITFADGAWTVLSPDGTQWTYSTDVPAVAPDGNEIGGSAREWLLHDVADTANNVIRYFYDPIAQEGISYPSAIVWGHPSARRAIRFRIDVNGDGLKNFQRTSYATGSRVIHKRLLTRIDVAITTTEHGISQDGAGGGIVRSYYLNYELGPISHAPVLKTIVETGMNTQNPTLPAGENSPDRKVTVFDYEAGSTSLTFDNGFLDGLERAGDQDMAATTDLTRIRCTYPDPNTGMCALTGQDVRRQRSIGAYKSNFAVADIDNDGLPEYIQGAGGPFGLDTDRPDEGDPDADTSKVGKILDGNPISGWDSNAVGIKVPAPFRLWDENAENRPSEDFGARFLDLNRDGTQDLLVSYENLDNDGHPHAKTAVWFNNCGPGTGCPHWSNRVNVSLPAGVPALTYYRQDAGLRIADVNGDGYPDLLHAYSWDMTGIPYPSARGITGCFDDPRPPQGHEVYLMVPQPNQPNAPPQWAQDPDYVLPSGISFVAPVPVDAQTWRCPSPGYQVPDTCQNRVNQAAALDADMGTQIIDVNGDGLPDIVKATNYRYDGCDVSEPCDDINYLSCDHDFGGEGNGVWINVGSGKYNNHVAWVKNGAYTQSLQDVVGAYLHSRNLLCKTNCEMDFALVDYNDDGLPDIQKKVGSGYIHFRNTGNGWVPHDEDNDAAYPGLAFGVGEFFQDFNGDGRPDYFLSSRVETFHAETSSHTYGVCSEGDNTCWKFYGTDGSHPDLLAQINNWMGGELHVSYDHSSRWRTQHNAKLPQVRYVVTNVTADADPGADSNVPRLKARDSSDSSTPGTGGVSSTDYKYKTGEFNFHAREFRGFGYVEATAHDGAAASEVVTQTYYLQDDQHKGLVDKVVVRTGVSGTVKQFKGYTYEILQPHPGVYDRRMTREIEKEDDDPNDPNNLVLRQVDYDYDDENTYPGGEWYGNLLAKTESGAYDGGVKRRTRWSYHPNEALWLVNYPATVRTYRVVGGSESSDPESETEYSYDTQASDAPPLLGLLTSTSTLSRFETVNGPRIVTEAEYEDPYGNKTADIDANGRRTEYQYPEFDVSDPGHECVGPNRGLLLPWR